jgi:flagellar hook-associated protein 2
VTYSSASATAKPGSYAVSVTQIATQGNETGSAAPTSLVIAAGSNDTLNMNVNGINATITLTPKTYATAQDLANELQSRINSNTALMNAGISVSAALNAGKISLTSNSYGATSSVVAASGNGVANIFGTAISTTGVNLIGSIDGVSATGSGQTLTASSGNAQGLSIFVNGGALGSRGTVTYTQGYAYNLNIFATSVLASTGSLSSSTTELNNTIKSLADRTTVLQQRLIGTEARYRAQYTALDQMLSSMNTTSTFLTQQLARMA